MARHLRRWLPGFALTVACQSPSTDESEAATDSSTTIDADTGEGSDALPPVPTLQSPADGSTELPLELELCWKLVEDPDGDPVRYRVFVDDTMLSQGRLGEEDGYAGPCVGPLLFAHERSYTWQVEAYEVDDPSRSSGKSEAWEFSTIGDGLSEQVFADDFESELGWTISGDAFAGAWVRGDPIAADDGERSSQPAACAGGSGCYFTGQNPDGLADQEDVAGGATTLTSPEFDLDGAAAATVRLQRFFYKSELMPGATLEVELLTPNAVALGGYDVHPLELLDAGTLESPANLWTPREYAACDLPMLAGSRLRVRASDPSSGILEAAIDSVSIHAHDDASFCASAVGGYCDPRDTDLGCPAELLCCSQGQVNVGVYRCEEPIAGLDYESPPASPDEPGNGALGCDAPDLIVEPEAIGPLMFTDIFMSDDTCEVLEGCVGGLGWRKVMLFTAATPNIGSRDLALGVPANMPELFHYSACHDHYHFDEFARYQLRDGDSIVATGHKQAFCLLDTTSWAWPLEPGQFTCANQGISRGFSDFYEAGLPCQWVDVTDMAPGEYTLRISLNQPRPGHAIPLLNERDFTNNVIDVQVTIP